MWIRSAELRQGFFLLLFINKCWWAATGEPRLEFQFNITPTNHHSLSTLYGANPPRHPPPPSLPLTMQGVSSVTVQVETIQQYLFLFNARLINMSWAHTSSPALLMQRQKLVCARVANYITLTSVRWCNENSTTIFYWMKSCN